MDGNTIIDLDRRASASPLPRHERLSPELTGFTEAMRDRLRAYSLFSEIISWKLRFFVPVDASGPGGAGQAARHLSGSPHLRIGRLRDGPPGRFRSRAPSRPAGRGGVPPLVCRAGGARAATGWSAMCATHRAARCMSGSRTRPKGRPASGPTPPPASMATSSTSSAKAAA